MPNDEALAAFNEAQQLAARMRDMQAKEEGLQAALDQLQDRSAIETLEGELNRVQRQWMDLSQAYTAAVGRFSNAVDQERRSQ
jgi:hypothetical protein